MTKLIGVAGSLRQGSLNAALLRAAAGMMPEGVELAIGTIRGIPLYDGDLEAADEPPADVAYEVLCRQHHRRRLTAARAKAVSLAPEPLPFG